MPKKQQTAFRRNDQVRTVVDLPGVPAGEPGKVLMVTGLEWARYFVAFENGRALGQIDPSKLERVGAK